jgi:thiosulfate/3-mercaptopyruvate sulfurtransferase
MAQSNYAHPEVLVDTEWTDQHKEDPNVRLVEVDVDTKAYEDGHIPGAVSWDWQTQLSDNVRRDIIPKGELEKLLGDSGIDNNTTILLYGDNNNWFAAWAFWQLKIYRHKDVRLINGGRKKWIAEGRPLSKDVPNVSKKVYKAPEPDFSVRAYLPDLIKAVGDGAKTVLVDVRSKDEYTGKILSPPGLPETCQRGGHIPKAVNVPWGKNVNDDGTFKSIDELRALYEPFGVKPDKEVVAYCRIGERSSLTWFVMKYLLGYESVKNYDGSWTEWGNLVNAPIERGERP